MAFLLIVPHSVCILYNDIACCARKASELCMGACAWPAGMGHVCVLRLRTGGTLARRPITQQQCILHRKYGKRRATAQRVLSAGFDAQTGLDGCSLACDRIVRAGHLPRLAQLASGSHSIVIGWPATDNKNSITKTYPGLILLLKTASRPKTRLHCTARRAATEIEPRAATSIAAFLICPSLRHFLYPAPVLSLRRFPVRSNNSRARPPHTHTAAAARQRGTAHAREQLRRRDRRVPTQDRVRPTRLHGPLSRANKLPLQQFPSLNTIPGRTRRLQPTFALSRCKPTHGDCLTQAARGSVQLAFVRISHTSDGVNSPSAQHQHPTAQKHLPTTSPSPPLSLSPCQARVPPSSPASCPRGRSSNSRQTPLRL
jgi:hypothetical protein